MKRTIFMLTMLLIGTTAFSQVDIKKIVKRKSKQRVEKKANESVDKGLSKVEKGVKNLFKKKDVKESEESEKSNESSIENEEPQSENKQIREEQNPELKWAKYDFVPGDEIIFEDDQVFEENGEFPSRWDLHEGRVENAIFDKQKVIYFMTRSSIIIPYLSNRKDDYLPSEFTLEFDAWFESGEHSRYYIWFYDKKNHEYTSELGKPILKISANAVKSYKSSGKYPGLTYEANYERSFWRHVSISFNRRALKVYLDDSRVLNVPNMEINPTGLSVGIDNFAVAGVKGKNRFIKNIRLSKGAVKLYEKLLQDGKIISNGIRFESGRATLKPESMGVINRIYDLMKEHPELKFSVEGHTDNTGNDESNHKFSETRAATVVNKLVNMGISKNRLISKGFGELMPISSNESIEGRANNRRVEFVKI